MNYLKLLNNKSSFIDGLNIFNSEIHKNTDITKLLPDIINEKTINIMANKWLPNLLNKYPNLTNDIPSTINLIRNSIKNINKLPVYTNYPGINMIPIITDGNKGDPKLSPIKITVFQPGSFIPAHQHLGDEFVYLLYGQITETVENSNTITTYYDSYHSKPESKHSVVNISNDINCCLVVLPNGGLRFFDNQENIAYYENLCENYKNAANKKRKSQVEPHIFLAYTCLLEILMQENNIKKTKQILQELETFYIMDDVGKQLIENLKTKINAPN